MSNLMKDRVDISTPTSIQTADEFICLVASSAELGDEIADRMDAPGRQIHPVLTDSARKSGMDERLFLMFVGQRVREGQYNDVLLLCMGDKLHHLLDGAWKSPELLKFDREIGYELEKLAASLVAV